jgi:DNA-binding NarL/FixJ family response regulator
MELTVAIVDDHPLFRKGFKNLLENIPEINTVIEASNGVEMLEILQSTKPDIVLTDIKMPEMDGKELTDFIKKHYPEIKVIVVSMFDDEDIIIDVVKRGANAFLSKQSTPEEVNNAIKSVLQNDYYFNEMVSAALVKGIIAQPDNNDKSSSKNKNKKSDALEFTDKELKVLKLICKEYTNNEIAEALDLSPKTIEGYKSRLLEKTGAKTSVGLALFALRNGIIRF